MSNYKKFTKTELQSRIRKGLYKTLTGANRAIGKSSNLSGTDKAECKKVAIECLASTAGTSNSSKRSVGVFLFFKNRLDSGRYKRLHAFKNVAAKASGLTEQERKTLLQLGTAWFDANAKKSLQHVSVKKQAQSLGHRFHKEEDFMLTFIRFNVNDPPFNAKVEQLLSGASSAGKTLPELLEAVRALKLK